jgi:hypothetical protein
LLAIGATRFLLCRKRPYRQQAGSYNHHCNTLPLVKCSNIFLSPTFDEYFQLKLTGCARLNGLVFSQMNIYVRIQI